MFSPLSECTYVDLGRNSIHQKEAGSFSGLDKIDGLDLYDNRFTTIEAASLLGSLTVRNLIYATTKFQILNQAHLWN